MKKKYDLLPDALNFIAWLILAIAIFSLFSRTGHYVVADNCFDYMEFMSMILTLLIQPLFYFCVALALARIVRKYN